VPLSVFDDARLSATGIPLARAALTGDCVVENRQRHVMRAGRTRLTSRVVPEENHRAAEVSQSARRVA
jgi:hypothetical protein